MVPGGHHLSKKEETSRTKTEYVGGGDVSEGDVLKGKVLIDKARMHPNTLGRLRPRADMLSPRPTQASRALPQEGGDPIPSIGAPASPFRDYFWIGFGIDLLNEGFGSQSGSLFFPLGRPLFRESILTRFSMVSCMNLV